MRKLKNEELGRPSLETFRTRPKLPLLILLDDVRSMHNVGSVFRTADAFALEALWLCGITGQPPHREIEKTALGATRSVQWHYARQAEDALRGLKQEGCRILAVEQAEASTDLAAFRPSPDERYVLVFGNEVHGVSEEAMALADDCLEIPQFGTKHSINIAVSAGIVVWDYYLKCFRL